MKYVFQFGIVWDHLPRLLDGAWLTIRLSLGAFALGFAIAIAACVPADGGTAAGARGHRRVRRVHPQHALPGSALHHLLLVAGARYPLRGDHGGADRHEPQFLGLRDRDRSLGHRGGAAQPDRGGALARLHPAADISPDHRFPGAAYGLSGACQPVRAADARLLDRVGDFRRGADRGHQLRCNRRRSARSSSTSSRRRCTC